MNKKNYLRIGFMGVGHMGHGAALNILQKSYPLMVLGNRNRIPVDDLISRGAFEAKNPQDLAANCDILFMCLPSAKHVEDGVFGDKGILKGVKPGFILVDSTTSNPDLTLKIGQALQELGADMVDAPLGRTPKEAELGKLSSFIGGSTTAVQTVKPVIEAFADIVIETGPLGSGHTIKLINNFLAIATSAVVGEAIAAGLRLGIDMKVFKQVVDSAGGNSVMFQRFMQWTLNGDDSHLQGMMSIAIKDLNYYKKLASNANLSTTLADASAEVYLLANKLGYEKQYMPTLSTVLANYIDGANRTMPNRN
jgi:3-hydroxyisobutyrate dehydrogenase-like beta-hydroxyacid dehydrogenase